MVEHQYHKLAVESPILSPDTEKSEFSSVNTFKRIVSTIFSNSAHLSLADR